MPVIECDPALARDRLEAAGVDVAAGNTVHERWRASHGDAVAVAYDDKVVVQGQEPWPLLGLLQSHGGRVHLYFDGASRGNPGRAAVGWVLVADGGIVAEQGNRIGRATNNEAEYEALIQGLEAARELGFDEIEVRGDAELIVRQVTGAYEVRAPNLRERRVRARELLESFDTWTISHVPRAVNDRADELANAALDDH